MQTPAHVLITGAAGQIGYLLTHRVASGEVYGERPIVLHLLDIPQAADKLEALKMELIDCAFSNVADIIITSELEPAFKDVECAFFVASLPLKPGEIRVDLLKKNAPIFKAHGEALSKYSNPNVKVLVVGNPANTNTLVSILNSQNIPAKNFSSLNMLDHNRALAEVADKLGVSVERVKNVIVWGNHADSMVPDLTHAFVLMDDGKEVPVTSLVEESYWREEFVKKISQRVWQIKKARGNTSANSPAHASIEVMKAWLFGTKPGQVLSFGIPVPENSPYGIKPGVVFSFPCTVDSNGEIHVVEGLEINEWLRGMLNATEQDLINEKAMALSQ